MGSPHAAVERQLDKIASTIDLRDVVRLYDKGSSGLMVGMDLSKLMVASLCDGSLLMLMAWRVNLGWTQQNHRTLLK